MSMFGLNNEQWIDLIISLGIIVLAILLTKPLLNLILGRFLKRLTKNTKTELDDVLLEAVRPPLFWLILVLAFQIGIERLDFLVFPNNFTFDDIFFTLYFLIGFSIFIKILNALVGWYIDEVAPKTESNLDDQVLPFFKRVINIVIVIIAGIILLDHFNVEVSGLVASLGVGSLAIALAAQSALSDTIGGFMIMLDQPFRIGDRIEDPGY